MISLIKNLNVLKRKAYMEGAKNKIISGSKLYFDFKKGHYAELAIMSILGRVSSFYKNQYDIDLNINFDFEKDSHGVDLVILGRNINIKSKYLNQSEDFFEGKSDIVILNYDLPGMYNFIQFMNYIDEMHYIPDSLVTDINYLWESYMFISVLNYNNGDVIVYNNYKDEHLNRFSLYSDILPSKYTYRFMEEKQLYKDKKSNNECTTNKKEEEIEMPQNNSDRFSVSDICKILNIDKVEFYSLIAKKKLNVSFEGATLYVAENDLQKYLVPSLSKEQPSVNITNNITNNYVINLAPKSISKLTESMDSIKNFNGETITIKELMDLTDLSYPTLHRIVRANSKIANSEHGEILVQKDRLVGLINSIK